MYHCKLIPGFGISYNPAGVLLLLVVMNPPKLKEKGILPESLTLSEEATQEAENVFQKRKKTLPARALTVSTVRASEEVPGAHPLGITACAGVSLSPSLVWRCCWICYILKSQGFNTCRVSFLLGLHLRPKGRDQRLQWDPLWSTDVSQRLGMECPNTQEIPWYIFRLKKRLSSMKSCYLWLLTAIPSSRSQPWSKCCPEDFSSTLRCQQSAVIQNQFRNLPGKCAELMTFETMNPGSFRA